MLKRLPKQIAHVKVVEIDAGDAPFFAGGAHDALIEACAMADAKVKVEGCACSRGPFPSSK
jgi:hypothetical protein